VESLLGHRLEVDRLHFAACLPAEWKEFKLRYRYRETYYHITVLRPDVEGDEEIAAASVTIDGVTQDDTFIVLVDDRREHRVEVRVASRAPVTAMRIGA
jgi:cyclic beta-1,2-glucan synthetase